jgi:hypothetical protein
MDRNAFVPAGERTVPAGRTQPCHTLPTPVLSCRFKRLIHLSFLSSLFLGVFARQSDISAGGRCSGMAPHEHVGIHRAAPIDWSERHLTGPGGLPG